MSGEAVAYGKIGIVGAGSFGTALAVLLSDATGGRGEVTVWGHDEEVIRQLAQTRENVAYMPGVALPEGLRFTHELEALGEAELVLLVTPSKAVREVSARLFAAGVAPGAVLLSCTKGLERGTGHRMSEIVAEFFPEHVVAALSGPGHAEEIARRMPCATVIGCGEAETGRRLQQTFSASWFRAYTNDDVAGAELGGALKNIYAIAAGVCDGLGLGDSAKAALLTRSLAEMVRLGVALGGKRDTFQGLSGIGDLMVTCYSQHSRNRKVGERIGKGETPGEIAGSMRMVAEGVPTTYSTFERAKKLGIEVPIIAQIRALLEGEVSPQRALGNLLARELKPE